MNATMARWIMLGVLGLAAAWPAQAEMPKRPAGRVGDFARILEADDIAVLSDLGERVALSAQAQMVVATVPSLEGLSVEEYAQRLFARWGVGDKGKNNGVLFLIAPQDRKMRIEVGYGLEGVITDGKAGRILDEAVIPYFKAGNYRSGIRAGAERIAAELTGDRSFLQSAPPPPETAAGGPPVGWKEKLLIILFFSLFIALGFYMLGAGLRGEKFFVLWGAGFGGIPLAMSVVFGLAMGFSVYILPGLAFIMLGAGLLTGPKLLKGMGRGGRGGGASGWSSGGGSGSSGSSSSSGSFGGGSSGGGGSSRSW